MEQLEAPDEIDWQARRDWFEERQAAFAEAGAPRPSEQGTALMIDLQAVFCAGAWAASVILAATVVESQSRESGHRLGADLPHIKRDELVWLHQLRNRLLHEQPGAPVFTVEDQWLRRGRWEGFARRAIDIAFAALYGRKGAP